MLHTLWVKFKHFVHHLFNPHCEHCESIESDLHVCRNCDYLRLLLEREQHEKRMLLNSILGATNKLVESEPMTDWNPVKPIETWTMRKNRLETEDRERARKLRDEAAAALNKTAASILNRDIDKLEKELGVE